MWSAKLVLLGEGAGRVQHGRRDRPCRGHQADRLRPLQVEFDAVVELIKRLFLVKLRSPDYYAAEPIEAVALFCGRFVE